MSVGLESVTEAISSLTIMWVTEIEWICQCFHAKEQRKLSIGEIFINIENVHPWVSGNTPPEFGVSPTDRKMYRVSLLLQEDN